MPTADVSIIPCVGCARSPNGSLNVTCRFHGVYWPAFLMAADLEPPRSILCHSHWTVDGEKMSKSKNNVVCPVNRSQVYTADGFRYFLLREGVPHSDGSEYAIKVWKRFGSAKLCKVWCYEYKE